MMHSVIPVLDGLTDEQVAGVRAAVQAGPPPGPIGSWRLDCTPTTLQLRLHRSPTAADRDPAAAVGDRELLLAAGAVLMNMRVSIRGWGLNPTVYLHLDQRRPDLLAVLRPVANRPAGADDTALAAAITADPGHPPGTGVGPIGPGQLNRLRRAARAEHTWLVALPSAARPDLDGTVTDPAPHPRADRPRSVTALIGTIHDNPRSWLAAGQAGQLVRLTAATLGLAASPPRPVLDPLTRRQLRELAGGALWPHTEIHVHPR